MTLKNEIEIVRPGLALPNLNQMRAQESAIREFQAACHRHLVSGHDYGVIPGTQKPTLLKPGAEKIIRLLGLSDEYDIQERTEDWEKGFFRYIIRCKLVHLGSGVLISSGLGECNTMEGRYRWRNAGRVCPQCGKEAIIKGKKEYGGGWLCFRNKGGCGAKWGDGAEEIEGQEAGKVENEDIYSLVNTVLKMAKKRAMVDAALSAGSLSDTFTQDMEDLADNAAAAAKEAPESPAQPPPATRPAQTPPAAQTAPKPGANPEQLALFEALKQARESLGWSQAEFLAYAQNNYRIQRVAEMTDEQIKEATAYMRGEQAADQGNDGQPEQPTMPGVAAGREHN